MIKALVKCLKKTEKIQFEGIEIDESHPTCIVLKARFHLIKKEGK